ncbi:MAG: flagellar biosynthetic protein FliO [Pseudobdellovibrionaceae bacterium]
MRWIGVLVFVISMTVHAAKSSVVTAEKTVAESAVGSQENTLAKPETVAIRETKAESEIPLNLEAPKKSSSEEGGLFRILFTLSMLGLIGTGAFFFLRKYSVPKERKHQTQIKVLQQHYLGPKKSLAIVRVAGESILIGVTDHNISMIKSLSLLDDEVPEDAPKSFDKVLGKDNWNSKIEFESEETKEDSRSKKHSKELDADEEFAISGVKDIVSKRLKGMRSIQ